MYDECCPYIYEYALNRGQDQETRFNLLHAQGYLRNLTTLLTQTHQRVCEY